MLSNDLMRVVFLELFGLRIVEMWLVCVKWRLMFCSILFLLNVFLIFLNLIIVIVVVLMVDG